MEDFKRKKASYKILSKYFPRQIDRNWKKKTFFTKIFWKLIEAMFPFFNTDQQILDFYIQFIACLVSFNNKTFLPASLPCSTGKKYAA